MPKITDNLKYHFKALLALKLKNYNKALKYFRRAIENDLTPEKKRSINYDYLMLEIAEKIYSKNKKPIQDYKTNFDNPHILILNSAISDAGGHTECALRFVKQFNNDFKITFLISGMYGSSDELVPVKSKIIENNTANFIKFSSEMSDEKKLFEIYDFIIKENITTIMVNIHPQDTLCAGILGLIKKHTNINIVFWNHADHYFTLGVEFADIIVTRCKNGKALAKNIKTKSNVISLPFLDESNEITVYSKEELYRKRFELGIPANSFVTLTGCQFYKILSSDDSYFKLIKKVLGENKNVYHIIISEFTQEIKEHIQKVIGPDFDRVVCLPYQANFSYYIQLSDLYIDSFPQGSALTLVDYIKHSKPVVIKICEENPIQSFETYLNDDYEYSCKTTDEMFEKIIKLIGDKDEYQRISHMVKKFYLDKYNIENVKKENLKLIK